MKKQRSNGKIKNIVNKAKEKEKMKENFRGITLIALVVTIIILLILASVTITTIIGNNGLIKRVSDSKTATEIAKEKETISTSYMAVSAGNSEAKVTVAELNTEINKELNGETATVEGRDDGPFYITYNKSGRKYTVDGKGNASENTADDVNPDKTKTWSSWPTIGEGTNDSPYLIQSIEDLVAFAKDVNKGNKIGNYDCTSIDLHISLDRDLDFCYSGSYIDSTNKYVGMLIADANENATNLSIIDELTKNEGWMPIGNEKSELYFQGYFNGNTLGKNHKLINLMINRKESQGQALFAATKRVNIENFELNNVSISGKGIVASLLAQVKYGTASDKVYINNCRASGKITAESSYMGGIIGADNGMPSQSITIENCENLANISSKYTDVGGIIGASNSNLQINDCINKGEISANGFIGGIIGRKNNNISILNCDNNADLVGDIGGNGYVAGIIGNYHSNSSSNLAKLTNCHNSRKYNWKYSCIWNFRKR